MQNKIIIISGPTASGKSSLAFELATLINGCVINADSMQIYKGLPILSAQPSTEEQNIIEHKLYSYLEPNENNSVYIWLKLVENCIKDTFKEGKLPIVVGGTGMYISRLVKGIKELPNIPFELRDQTIKLFEKIGYNEFYNLVQNIDHDAVNKLNKNDKQRLMRIYEIYKISGKNLTYYENVKNDYLFNQNMFFHINLSINRESLYDRCRKRFEMIVNDAENEVDLFLNKYSYVLNSKSKYSIISTLGFKEFLDFKNGIISKKELIENTVKTTRHYAKRQCTWFKNQFDKFDYQLLDIFNNNNLVEIVTILKQL